MTALACLRIVIDADKAVAGGEKLAAMGSDRIMDILRQERGQPSYGEPRTSDPVSVIGAGDRD